jgi:MYXO-CTERM domain-containing protein
MSLSSVRPSLTAAVVCLACAMPAAAQNTPADQPEPTADNTLRHPETPPQSQAQSTSAQSASAQSGSTQSASTGSGGLETEPSNRNAMMAHRDDDSSNIGWLGLVGLLGLAGLRRNRTDRHWQRAP